MLLVITLDFDAGFALFVSKMLATTWLPNLTAYIKGVHPVCKDTMHSIQDGTCTQSARYTISKVQKISQPRHTWSCRSSFVEMFSSVLEFTLLSFKKLRAAPLPCLAAYINGVHPCCICKVAQRCFRSLLHF